MRYLLIEIFINVGIKHWTIPDRGTKNSELIGHNYQSYEC